MQHTWDLTPLYTSKQDAQNACLSALLQAKAFHTKYENKLPSLCIKELAASLTEFEEIIEKVERVRSYAHLIFSKDSKQGAILSEFELEVNNIYDYLIFFELDIVKLESSVIEELQRVCPQYAFYLERLCLQARHNLSIKEEQTLLKVSSLGVEAFSRLFDEHLARMKFECEGKQMGEEEILSLLHHSDRTLRESAQETFTKELSKSSHLLGYILNIVRKDVEITRQMRNYEKSESFRHLSNCISQKSVDALFECVNKNMDLVARYYKCKAKILGYELKDYDRYAPISQDEGNVSYEEGLAMVKDAFSKFSPIFVEIMEHALNNGWIDSHPAPLKVSGAFSHGCVPSIHPYVLLNYTSKRRDVFTIAHEFGHMVHQELSKNVGCLSANTPLTTAETASIFAEMLLFNDMKESLSADKRSLISIYAGKIEDVFSTLFRQIVMSNFERAIHANKGELNIEEFNRIWLEENEKMFGDSVKLSQNYALWWSYIPHFIHSPFYCYAYAYGQLLVLALFGLYRRANTQEERKGFVDSYIMFLRAGGSKAPKELIARFGLDIESVTFWEIGMQEVRTLLQEFEELL